MDASHIYWANLAPAAPGTINEAPLTGGTVTTLESGQAEPTEVAVDASHIYWASGGTINEAPLTGGTVTTLANAQGFPGGVAVGP